MTQYQPTPPSREPPRHDPYGGDPGQASPYGGAAPHYYPGAYPPYPPQRGTNVLAIVSLVTSLLGMAIIPVITGHIALSQIKNTGEGGNALALVGMILGYLQILVYVILFGLMVWGGLVIWSSS